ncbi:MAG: CrcB family protein [Prevotellaceae bacterium]|jgi:CrcB protein|nr:CrcB family protein [Prevotellaceae bacterium]
MILKLLLIGIGGGMGSILRYLTSVFVEKHFHYIFPIATFVVNFVGCLLIGLLLGFFEQQQIVNNNLKNACSIFHLELLSLQIKNKKKI